MTPREMLQEAKRRASLGSVPRDPLQIMEAMLSAERCEGIYWMRAPEVRLNPYRWLRYDACMIAALNPRERYRPPGLAAVPKADWLALVVGWALAIVFLGAVIWMGLR